MDSLQGFRGHALGMAWDALEISMGFSKDSHGLPKPTDVNGIPKGFQRDSLEISRRFPFKGIPQVRTRSFKGIR